MSYGHLANGREEAVAVRMQTESRDAVGGPGQVQGREHLLGAGLYIDRVELPLRALARGVSNDAVDLRAVLGKAASEQLASREFVLSS
jgi:hypothetical protein